MDPVVEARGSDCLVSLECFLNVVRALGMGCCLSRDTARSIRAIKYFPVPFNTNEEQTILRWRNFRRKVTRSDSSSYNSLESKMEMWLHRVPGRICLNGSTDSASLFTKQGRKGVNQDAMVFWENFGSKDDTIFCGVFDGHGPNGHLVAKKVRDSLPLKVRAQWELDATTCKDDVNGISQDIRKETTEVPPFQLINEDSKTSHWQHQSSNYESLITLTKAFLEAFKVMDKELKLHPHIDCFCSGATAATVVKQGQDLIIGNLGDSRIILGTKDDDESLIAIQLTVDLKPNLPREAERINYCKGRVFALPNEPEVARVWMPSCDCPGLAMARAFGDFCLKDFGLISVPDIFYHRVTERDEFVVLATDGVWDVLSNQEVVDIVGAASKSSAPRVVVESAIRAWRYKHPLAKIDDCAVVCLFLNSNTGNSYHANPKILEFQDPP